MHISNKFGKIPLSVLSAIAILVTQGWLLKRGKAWICVWYDHIILNTCVTVYFVPLPLPHPLPLLSCPLGKESYPGLSCPYEHSQNLPEVEGKVYPWVEFLKVLQEDTNTGPDSSVGRVSAPGNGRSRVRSRAATYQSRKKMGLAAPRLALRLTG